MSKKFFIKARVTFSTDESEDNIFKWPTIRSDIIDDDLDDNENEEKYDENNDFILFLSKMKE